jgi:hypothetical protein
MFNDGVINMDRVLMLFTFTSQMGQQYHTDTWKFWDIYRKSGNFGHGFILAYFGP